MSKLVVAYPAAAACFFALDMLWLGVLAKDFYRNALGDLLRQPPNWTVAGLFYAIYLVGLIIFGILPGLQAGSLSKALLYGGLFGFFAYATYDLTNLATLKNWPTQVALVDVAWGTFVSALAAVAGYTAASAWTR